jgi:hypothetical protein
MMPTKTNTHYPEAKIMNHQKQYKNNYQMRAEYRHLRQDTHKRPSLFKALAALFTGFSKVDQADKIAGNAPEAGTTA